MSTESLATAAPADGATSTPAPAATAAAPAPAPATTLATAAAPAADPQPQAGEQKPDAATAAGDGKPADEPKVDGKPAEEAPQGAPETYEFKPPEGVALSDVSLAAFSDVAKALDLPQDKRNVLATVMFVVFALTDWLDGYLARRLNQTSAFGAFLDPVADKFLVCACLLVLLDLQRVDVFVALIIIGREIAISALREWMATIGANRSVAVHRVGKIKTGVQMVAIGFLLFDGHFLGLLDTRTWGTGLIWLSVVLTVWSMVYYLQKAIPEIRARSR